MDSKNNPVIMTLDDDPVTLNLIVAILKKKDYRVRPFVSAKTAFNYLALPESPKADLILLDYHMPDLDGPEVLRRLQAQPDYAGIPVIFLTGRGEDPGERLELLALGAVDVLNKPPAPAALHEKIEMHLGLA